MYKVSFSHTGLKRSKAELVIDRKVVDQAIIDADNPVAVFVAEYIDAGAGADVFGGSAAGAVSQARQKNSLYLARMLLAEFLQLVAEIDETDPESVDDLLSELSNAFKALPEEGSAE